MITKKAVEIKVDRIAIEESEEEAQFTQERLFKKECHYDKTNRTLAARLKERQKLTTKEIMIRIRSKAWLKIVE